MLTIFEELVLLSIHEAKGTFMGPAVEKLKVGLGGAVLAELALMGKIQATNNHRLQVIDDTPTEVGILNDALVTLKGSDKEHKFGYWINSLSQPSDRLRKEIVDGLVLKNVLSQEEDRLHWVIPSPLDAEAKASSKFLVIKRLRGTALAAADRQTRDIVLLSLVKACWLLDLVFFRDERKLAVRSISELLLNQAVQDPVIQTIQEIEAVIAEMVEDD